MGGDWSVVRGESCQVFVTSSGDVDPRTNAVWLHTWALDDPLAWLERHPHVHSVVLSSVSWAAMSDALATLEGMAEVLERRRGGDALGLTLYEPFWPSDGPDLVLQPVVDATWAQRVSFAVEVLHREHHAEATATLARLSTRVRDVLVDEASWRIYGAHPGVSGWFGRR